MKTISMLSQRLGALLEQHGLMMITAESCTGGGIASAMTDTAGSSAWFDRGYVTYSNAAKQAMLQVESDTLEKWGAVSEPVVEQMVFGALNMDKAEVAVAVSGIAGPGGGSEAKPVGTVCFAWADTQGWHQIETRHFDGDRAQVREAVVAHALAVMIEHYQSPEV